jgi:hypothetical protein
MRGVGDFGFAAAGAPVREVARCAYPQDRRPDLDTVDDRPEETLFLEAAR